MRDELEIKDEEIFLLGLCRLTFTGEQAGKLRELVNKISDWDYFGNLANVHGTGALVYHNIERLGFLDVVPGNVASSLKSTLMKSLARNAFHMDMISDILRLLNKENIRTVILKGLALEIDVYKNSGLRQMTDIDILIDRRQHRVARQILIANGFTSLPVKSIFHLPIIAWSGKHLPSLVKNGSSLDIHLELFGGKKNDLTSLLIEGSYPVTINGQKAYIPQHQLFFLYLVRHLYLHEINNESQLRLYTDLVVMIEKYYDQIINNDLITFASQAGMSQILAWRLAPLRDLWGISFPDRIDAFIDSWYNPGSINRFINFLKSPKNNLSADNPMVYRKIIQEIPGFHRKVLFVLGDLFPTFTFMKKRYGCDNNLKTLLYYPHRFGKLIWLLSRGAERGAE